MQSILAKKNIALVLMALIWSASANAHVSLKNGNFFIPFKDIVYPGGFEPKVERVYNSKTSFSGIFGLGWGTEYEAHLNVGPDGSVTVHEYGGGATNRFSPVKFNTGELDKAINELVNAARKSGFAGTQEQLQAYRNRLRTDIDFRDEEWTRFLKQGKVRSRLVHDGEQLVSTAYSYQYITKVKDGYYRTFDNGRSEKFNDMGRIVEISDKNHNYIRFSYNKEGFLEKLVDNFNRKMFFTFNKKGLLERVQGENNKEAIYQYNDQNLLTYSKDAAGNTAKYKYTNDKLKNLSEISYTEKKSSKSVATTEIAYWGKDKYSSVKSVKEMDGTFTEYDYGFDSPQKGSSWVAVKVKDKSSNLISSSKYEYFSKINNHGEPWTFRMVSTIDGDRTETTYHEGFGLPVAIKKDGLETLFEYDSKGRVVKKTTPTEITFLKYDSRASKVARVEHTSRVNKSSKTWAEFQYDENGNLKFARNSDRKAVKLIYDTSGRIISMLDQAGHKLTFKYNENSKPVEIHDAKLGTITVSYNNSGEVKNVDAVAGRKIALQVTSTFQNLLDIIRPAGVNLSF